MIGVAFSGQQILTGGAAGQLNSSPNGISWNQETGYTRGIIDGIAFGDGRYVTTTTSAGKILTSTDGIQWSEISTGVTVNSEAVAFLQNEFLAVGQQGKIATSSDGLSWNEQVLPTPVFLREISTDGATAVVVGNDGVILYSSDLVTWNPATTGSVTEDLLAVTCGSDGSSHRFVAVGLDGVILHSPNGQVWTQASSSGTTTEHIYDVVAVGTQYVAVGSHGLILTSQFGDIWVPQVSGVTSNLFHVLHDGQRYRIFGSMQTGLISQDATTWHSAFVPVWSGIQSSVQVEKKIFCVGSNGLVVENETTPTPYLDWPQPLDITDFISEVNNCGP